MYQMKLFNTFLILFILSRFMSIKTIIGAYIYHHLTYYPKILFSLVFTFGIIFPCLLFLFPDLILYIR